jgi:hypothetical protein
MFRPLLGRLQVYCLCLGPELVFFNMDPYFEYNYTTCNIIVPLPPGENPFAVKINNNNNS